MENVPRVAGILERELASGSLQRFQSLVTTIQVVDSADYGVPQNRKRMIAGNFPIELFNSYKLRIEKVFLKDVLDDLSKKKVIDSNYGYRIDRSKVTELENEVDLTPQEERINRDSKSYHPVYNNMSFPDRLNRPSRTVTATCTRVSRESIIVASEAGRFRRLNVRERGVVQGFPITYQFYGKSLNAKFKMIGNAVPPVLTYYIFQSMLEVPVQQVQPPSQSEYIHKKPRFDSYKSNLGLPKRKFPAKRKFKFAVPNLRYGSGVRFELSNDPKSNGTPWSFKFFYGNSKSIKEVELDKDLMEALGPEVNSTKNKVFKACISKVESKYKGLNSAKLQEDWTSVHQNDTAFEFLDYVGGCVKEILNNADLEAIPEKVLDEVVEERNRKLNENKNSILTGFYLLSTLNQKLFI